MKISKLIVSLIVSLVVLLASTSQTMATGKWAQTIVDGMVYGPDGTPVSSGSVYVTCGSGNQTVSILSDGTYHAFFEQTICKAGALATATATTSQGDGSNSGTVQNSVINGPKVDLDVAVINIHLTVPEFGMLTGIISMVGAAGSYFYMKAKIIA